MPDVQVISVKFRPGDFVQVNGACERIKSIVANSREVFYTLTSGLKVNEDDVTPLVPRARVVYVPESNVQFVARRA
jgi:hypothetical protein